MHRFLLVIFVFASVYCGAQELPQGRLSANAQGIFDNDLLPAEFHRERRKALRELLPSGSVAVLFANPVRNRSNDVDFEYHQDPDLYYLCGLREPNAVLLVAKDSMLIKGSWTNEVLVLMERDPSKEIWNGHRTGVDAATELLGISEAISGKEFLELQSTDLAAQKDFVHKVTENLDDDGYDPADLHGLIEHFNSMATKIPEGSAEQLERWMAGLREVKHPEELELMRRAIDITCEAQRTLIQALEPDMTEYQTEAIVEYVFKKNGAEYEGFPSIQGGGPHSCVLHYVTNRRKLDTGDLLVSDIGAEYHGYTADVTRTIPASGKFTTEQRAIYDLVHRAQEAGIQEVKVGAPFMAAHKAATKIIAAGLQELGIVKGPEEVGRYFMHGTSHYLGLDVHDAGTYGVLKENSVITVEPGIYIAADSPCDPKWWNIGVRIEDDILVTTAGPENLSDCVPRKAEEIEKLMAGTAPPLPGGR